MTNVSEQVTRPAASRGIILHSPRFYDLLVFIATWGRESAFRQQVLDLARLEHRESVLDVGCGTGTLAMAAKLRIGRDAKVSGIDASPEMIARASKKARNAGVEIEFRNESIEALPFADGTFDVVLSTVMLHHLPRKVRKAGMSEIRRVLRPGGRVLIVDFAGTERQHGLFAHVHRRHGHVSPAEIIALLKDVGLNVIENGAVGVRDLHYALAQSPCCHL
jgi:ubiquinone/menaquinone biosynthesis C-methylase UbiE